MDVVRLAIIEFGLNIWLILLLKNERRYTSEMKLKIACFRTQGIDT